MLVVFEVMFVVFILKVLVIRLIEVFVVVVKLLFSFWFVLMVSLVDELKLFCELYENLVLLLNLIFVVVVLVNVRIEVEVRRMFFMIFFCVCIFKNVSCISIGCFFVFIVVYI